QLYIPGKSYRLLAGGRDKDVSKAGTNPYEGVSFFYQLPADLQDEQSLSLSVYGPGEAAPLWTWTGKTEDESEEPAVEGEVATAVLGTEAGLHRHVWNLEHPGMERFDNLILWADMKAGPKAVPGVYRAVLQQDTLQKEVRFEVLADPRSQATPENYAEQFAFVVQSRDLLTRTHREIKRIRALRSQLDSLLERLKSEPEDPITAKLNALNALLTEVEEALYQTKNESRQDPLNFPIRLNNKLVSLMRTVAQDDLGPTEQAWKVKAELSAAIERQLAKLDSVWSEQVPALNDAVRAQGVDMISLEKLASED
ncbi:MAG: glycosyl hydrolase, partial [Pseudomonadota bacterium]